ncbi:MAG: hypothetical protein ABJB86_24470 [Bacteroidota bacterium]
MNMLKKLARFSGRLLVGFMFAVCMVIGVVPIIPKRKEQFSIEVKMEKVEKETGNQARFIKPEKNIG